MKKILKSLFMVTALAAIVVGGTQALFSDTETSTGNTFTTGDIDIAVDGENPWRAEGKYQLLDMKPSQVEYTNFTITNVGSNPVNVTKEVEVVDTNDGYVSEPECEYGGGSWDGQCSESYDPRYDIDSVITYDLSVELYNPENELIWHQVLYNMDKTIAEIKDEPMFLGMIPSKWYMKVTESYHMLTETENWAQGDEMHFNIVLTGEQLRGVAVLEDKTTDWQILGDTDPRGVLKYGVKDNKFTYTFEGIAPLTNMNYSLVAYHEPWSTPSDSGWPRDVDVLGTAMSDGSGKVEISGSLELGHDLLDIPVWLVKTADIVAGQMKYWHHDAYLFDTGLLDYYRSGY